MICKRNLSIPPPPILNRKGWEFEKHNFLLIIRAISEFPWQQRLNGISIPSLQVDLLNETILNVMSNFVPNMIILKLNQLIRLKKSRECLKRKIGFTKNIGKMALRKPIRLSLIHIETNVLKQLKKNCQRRTIFVNLDIKYLSSYKPVKILDQIYKMSVRPHLLL